MKALWGQASVATTSLEAAGAGTLRFKAAVACTRAVAIVLDRTRQLDS
jgi:hypothetical protein